VARRHVKQIRVALVDAHPVVRRGLEVSLARSPGLKIISAGSDVEDAFDRIASPPDVVIIDAASAGGAARRIRRRFPDAKVIVFTSMESERRVRDAARGGAQAYLRKSAPVEEIVRAIETVYGGRMYFGPLEPGTAIAHPSEPYKEPLTRRERQVLKLVAQGLTSRDIASLLRVSIRTVESHRGHIARKLDIHTIAGLTRFAIAQGLVD
jgi:two-component system nitrate/nitrite response regulator NarL